MIFGTYTFTEKFGIPYEWAEMPRWYIIAGQVSCNAVVIMHDVHKLFRIFIFQF